jgi:hypothetical protein
MAMRHRAVRPIPALALVLAVGTAAGGCATAGAASGGSAPPATASAAARTSAPVYGPPAPDAACVAALKAEKTLQARQVKDQDSESALDQDFTDFADALSAAAQHETRPAAARAMTALASDYTDLVESQSGAAQLPAMNTVQSDGAAFDKACALFTVQRDGAALFSAILGVSYRPSRARPAAATTPSAGVRTDPGGRFPQVTSRVTGSPVRCRWCR